jgi:hypothetical protein
MMVPLAAGVYRHPFRLWSHFTGLRGVLKNEGASYAARFLMGAPVFGQHNGEVHCAAVMGARLCMMVPLAAGVYVHPFRLWSHFTGLRGVLKNEGASYAARFLMGAPVFGQHNSEVHCAAVMGARLCMMVLGYTDTHSAYENTSQGCEESL